MLDNQDGSTPSQHSSSIVQRWHSNRPSIRAFSSEWLERRVWKSWCQGNWKKPLLIRLKKLLSQMVTRWRSMIRIRLISSWTNKHEPAHRDVKVTKKWDDENDKWWNSSEEYFSMFNSMLMGSKSRVKSRIVSWNKGPIPCRFKWKQMETPSLIQKGE